MNPVLAMGLLFGALLLLGRRREDRPRRRNLDVLGMAGLLYGLGKADQRDAPTREKVRGSPLARAGAILLTDEERRQLEAARDLSRQFHGSDRHVWQLSERERHLPRFVVEAGKIDQFAYAPERSSRRGDSAWEHQSGDRGSLRRKGRDKPHLMVNPLTRKPVWIPGRSKMKLTDKGFVG